jgi:putative FmdB family regulatory protein
MPIYEFYCEDCNTIFNFFSRRVNTEKIPDCPRCKVKKLKRLLSPFNTLRSEARGDSDNPDVNIDESKIMNALSYLEKHSDRIDENDPKQAVQLMRRFTEIAGLNLGSKWQEALDRIEAGEDPEAVEADMGELLDEELPLLTQKKNITKRKPMPPRRDGKLYEL